MKRMISSSAVASAVDERCNFASSKTIAVLGTDSDEILIDAAKPLRANAGANEHDFVTGFNAQMMTLFAGAGRPSLAGRTGESR